MRTFLRRRYAAFGFVLTIPCQQHTFQLFSVPKFIPRHLSNRKSVSAKNLTQRRLHRSTTTHQSQKKTRQPCASNRRTQGNSETWIFSEWHNPIPIRSIKPQASIPCVPKEVARNQKKPGGASCPMEAPTSPTRSHNFHKTWDHPSLASRPGLNLAVL